MRVLALVAVFAGCGDGNGSQMDLAIATCGDSGFPDLSVDATVQGETGDGGAIPITDSGATVSDANTQSDHGVLCLTAGRSCTSSETCCPSGCTNTDTDPNNCGMCDNACGDGGTCMTGTCQ